MTNALLATDASFVNLVLRVVLGLVILPHGLQKLFGWFGGHGFKGTMGFLTGAVKLPVIVAFLVIVIESFGSLALVLGFLGRVSALGVAAVMIGAAVTAHLSNGFFMNWTGQQKGEGYEFHILAVAMALPVILFGSGAYSLDRVLLSLVGA